jgi:hypothetical protein
MNPIVGVKAVAIVDTLPNKKMSNLDFTVSFKDKGLSEVRKLLPFT